MSGTGHQAEWLKGLQDRLEQRRDQHLLRSLRRIDSAQGTTLLIEGVPYLQFCTNNYLGLADDPEVIDAAVEATEQYGTGASASRLVAGSMALHHELEEALAQFKGTEAALLFPTGFMANLAVLTTFAGENDTIVSDKLNHASLLDAARYSGANCRTFPHRAYSRAEELLTKPSRTSEKEASPLKFLITDSVFSMDGDLADLNTLTAIAGRANALLFIDDAHGTGVLGERGTGLAELQNVSGRIALTVGTLSKALGSVGGFVAGPRAVIDPLINEARTFIYTTALPPACSAAGLAALKIVQREPQRRQRVMKLASQVKEALVAMGWNCGDSATPIIPLMMGGSDTALEAAEFLKERGIFVAAIRPPTVPPNSARLRLSLMATHTDAEIERLLAAMKALREHIK